MYSVLKHDFKSVFNFKQTNTVIRVNEALLLFT
jgi:hypothetical protein